MERVATLSHALTHPTWLKSTTWSVRGGDASVRGIASSTVDVSGVAGGPRRKANRVGLERRRRSNEAGKITRGEVRAPAPAPARVCVSAHCPSLYDSNAFEREADTGCRSHQEYGTAWHCIAHLSAHLTERLELVDELVNQVEGPLLTDHEVCVPAVQESIEHLAIVLPRR